MVKKVTRIVAASLIFCFLFVLVAAPASTQAWGRRRCFRVTFEYAWTAYGAPEKMKGSWNPAEADFVEAWNTPHSGVVSGDLAGTTYYNQNYVYLSWLTGEGKGYGIQVYEVADTCGNIGEFKGFIWFKISGGVITGKGIFRGYGDFCGRWLVLEFSGALGAPAEAHGYII